MSPFSFADGAARHDSGEGGVTVVGAPPTTKVELMEVSHSDWRAISRVFVTEGG